jgi:hypothetical protein
MSVLDFARRAAKEAKAKQPSPMVRLLSSGSDGQRVSVDNASHWQTFSKAVRLGFINDDSRLTDKGRAYLAEGQRSLRGVLVSQTIPKGHRDGECNRTACHNPNARWYNPHTNSYYCQPCAFRLNEEMRWADLKPLWRSA